MAPVQYTEWALEADVAPILDFRITLRSIPPWMSHYSSANNGCVHRIQATVKVKDSQSNFEGFTREVCSIIPKTQWKSLKKVLYHLSIWGLF
jgi:hypothetical protein